MVGIGGGGGISILYINNNGQGRNAISMESLMIIGSTFLLLIVLNDKYCGQFISLTFMTGSSFLKSMIGREGIERNCSLCNTRTAKIIIHF